MENETNKPFYTTSEAGKILGISRIAVLKRVKNGKLIATRVGKNYIFLKADLQEAAGISLSAEQKDEIKHVVKRAVKEYKVTFRRLGKEE